MHSALRPSLPADLIEILEAIDARETWSRTYEPVLPADETPQELIMAALQLSTQLIAHSNLRVAAQISRHHHAHIEAVLAQTVTEPIGVSPSIHLLDQSDLREYPSLRTAWAHFVTLLHSGSPCTPLMKIWRDDLVFWKQQAVGDFRLEFDLTDEEWATL